ncbi:MAG: flagellar export chaperone FliS [Ruthenibacterium sp.]
MNNNFNPYKAYKQQSVMTMTPGGMLTMLYDGLLKELSLAQQAFTKNDYEEINRSLQKAQRILHHLQVTLEPQYEISKSLSALYDYFMRTAMQANMKKDPAGLPEIIQMITELRDVYSEADRKTRAAEYAG